MTPARARLARLERALAPRDPTRADLYAMSDAELEALLVGQPLLARLRAALEAVPVRSGRREERSPCRT